MEELQRCVVSGSVKVLLSACCVCGLSQGRVRNPELSGDVLCREAADLESGDICGARFKSFQQLIQGDSRRFKDPSFFFFFGLVLELKRDMPLQYM